MLTTTFNFKKVKQNIICILFVLLSYSISAESMFSGMFDKGFTESVLWKTLKDPALRDKTIAEIKKDIQKYTDRKSVV